MFEPGYSPVRVLPVSRQVQNDRQVVTGRFRTSFFVVSRKTDDGITDYGSDMDKEQDINIRNAIICWFITFGYMGLIFFLSSQQSFHIHGLPANADKAVHTFIYIPLAFMLYLSLNTSGLKKALFVVAFIFAGIYGITDEFHQYYVPGRQASAGDVAADFFGALLGSTGAKHFIKRNNK